MSTHSPRLQFVIVLPDSSKTEAKGVVLVKGSWYETSGSLGLPFNLNQSLSFPSLSQLSMTYAPLGRLCFLHAPHFRDCEGFDMLSFLKLLQVGASKAG